MENKTGKSSDSPEWPPEELEKLARAEAEGRRSGTLSATGTSDHGLWVTHFEEFDGWDVAAHLIEQDGNVVIAELRIQPAQTGGALAWPPQWRPNDPVPKGGLRASHMRSLRLGTIVRRARFHTHGVSDHLLAILGSDAANRLMSAISAAPRRPGRKGHPDEYYAVIAQMYVRELMNGRHDPIKRIAEAIGYSETHVRDQVAKARQKGFLTPAPGRGKSGGNLTPTALDVLNEVKEVKDSTLSR